MGRLLIILFIFVAFGAEAQIPALNKAIVAFCDSVKGKKIGRGECWDLASAALNHTGAKWTSPYGFGRELKKGEAIMPGDIVQFEKVEVRSPDGGGMNLPHHTAIVHDVHSATSLTIAEQNSNNRRFVVFSEIELKHIKKGSVVFYRPEK